MGGTLLRKSERRVPTLDIALVEYHRTAEGVNPEMAGLGCTIQSIPLSHELPTSATTFVSGVGLIPRCVFGVGTKEAEVSAPQGPGLGRPCLRDCRSVGRRGPKRCVCLPGRDHPPDLNWECVTKSDQVVVYGERLTSYRWFVVISFRHFRRI